MKVRHAVATCLMGAVGATCLPAVATAHPAPPTALSTPAISSVTTVATPPTAVAALIPGASGSHIVALQRALIARGHAIPAGATGYFGSQTKSAVAAFQRAQGWRGSGADGIPGPQTLARLGGAATVRTVAAPSASIPAPTGALSPATFVARYGPVARSAGAATGVPPLVTLAQAALESGWGRGAAGNNFFGVKARASDSAKQLRTTYEVLSSPNVRSFPQVISVSRRSDGLYHYTVREYFRTYSSAEQSFRQHNQLLRSSRYSAAFRYTGDPYRFAAAIAAGGYATDPAYTSKLHAVMRMIERYGFR
jgi:peptidoglycan hydrolase-like protein with peptidoglycan-binding domain